MMQDTLQLMMEYQTWLSYFHAIWRAYVVFILGVLAGTVAPTRKLNIARNAVRQIRPYRTLGSVVPVILPILRSDHVQSVLDSHDECHIHCVGCE